MRNVVGKNFQCHIGAAGGLDGLAEVNGNHGRTALPAAGEKYTPAQQAHPLYDVAQIRSRCRGRHRLTGHNFIIHRRTVPQPLTVQQDALYDSAMF